MICRKTSECFPKILRDQSSNFCNGQSKCVRFCDKRKNASCKEKSKVYLLENTKSPHKILCVHVDGGVVIVDKDTPAGVLKCDYLYVIETEKNPVAILIELKGVDIKHAIEQIDSTIDLLSEFLKSCSQVHGRIVFSGGTPNLQNTPYFMKLQKKLKRLSGTLQASGKAFTEKLSDMLY